MQAINCRFCGKQHYKPAGYRDTKPGKKRLYRCMVCKRKFTPDSAFLKMKNDPSIVVQCMDLYISGLSLRAVSQHMKRRGIVISHTAIRSWICKFSRMIKPYTDSFKINAQDDYLYADEMMVKMHGQWVWIWNVMSKKDRFIVASRISKTRTMPDAKAVFRETRSKIDGMPMRITTDSMNAYPRAINSSFYRRQYPKVEHYVAPGITHRHQNNLIERHHNTIRSRTKVMRGFGEMDSARDTMNLWHAHFNYIRPNMALNGKTPAESAGLGKHDLFGLIEEAYEWNRRR